MSEHSPNPFDGDAFDEIGYREIVESAGAVFVGLQQGSKRGEPIILFQPGLGESTLALYASACETKADVEMALKNYREAQRLVKVVGL